MSRTLRGACVLVLVTAVGSCGRPAEPFDLPDLAGVEPQVATAIQDARDAARANDTGEDWLALGRSLHVHGFESSAVEAYRRAAARLEGGSRFEPLYLIGCALEAENPQAATTALREAIAVRNDYQPAFLRLGRLLEDAGRLDEAEAAYRRAAELGASSHAELGLGRILLARGDPRAALKQLRAALRLAPGHSEVHAALAQTYTALGRTDAARQAAQRAGDLRVRTPFADPLMQRVYEAGVSHNALVKLALAWFKGGRREDLEKALALVDRALEVKSDVMRTHFHRGMILANLGRTDEALAEFERVLNADPNDVEALNLAGSCLYQKGRHQMARALLMRAVALDPNHAESRYNLAVVLHAAREDEEAKKHVRFVIANRPERDDARLLLAEILAAAGDRAGARAQLERILRRNPRDPRARRALEGLDEHR